MTHLRSSSSQPEQTPRLAQSPHYYARNICFAAFILDQSHDKITSSRISSLLKSFIDDHQPFLYFNARMLLQRKGGRADRLPDSSAGDSSEQTRQIKCDRLGQTCLHKAEISIFFGLLLTEQNWLSLEESLPGFSLLKKIKIS